jgi:starch phosphorylase
MTINAETMFDVQVKRIHEYKRQLLNLLYVVTLYTRIKRDGHDPVTPRTVIFGGKAAPGYYMAKLIIKLINSVAATIDADHRVRDRLRVVFIPDFNVSSGQVIYPAAELSEQISTAGKEASGTGNMKFSMNGALTIGTLDGANVEIREQVGPENFFLFGMTVEQVMNLKAHGYNPRSYYDANPVLKDVIDQITAGAFSAGDQQLFRPIVDSLLNQDQYFLLADYQSYIDCQDAVSHAYLDQEHWTRMSILNTARMGFFSSDRSILDYARDIWHVKSLSLPAEPA